MAAVQRNRRIRASAFPGGSAGERPWTRSRLRRLLPIIVLDAALAVAAAGVIAGFFVGGRFLSRWMGSSPTFALDDIVVDGEQHLTVEEILSAAGVVRGASIFSVDAEEIRSRLLENSWIREVQVVRRMPGSLSIEIVERECAALLWSGSLYRVDRDGTVFEKLPAGAPMDAVVVTGLMETWVDGDREHLSLELRRILQILAEYGRMGLQAIAPVTSVHREHGGGIVFFVGEDARGIRIGSGHTRKKLERLRAVLRELRSGKLEWEYIMVDSRNFPERVVVKLRQS